MSTYPAIAVPDGALREHDRSPLWLNCHRTMVADGLAVQRVQPCPRNPLALNEVVESRRAPGYAKKAGGGAANTGL